MQGRKLAPLPSQDSLCAIGVTEHDIERAVGGARKCMATGKASGPTRGLKLHLAWGRHWAAIMLLPDSPDPLVITILSIAQAQIKCNAKMSL